MDNEFKNRIGHDNFVWWMGVVELRDDPLNLGRVKVRIFGSHTSDKKLIPTENLPWAQPMLPVNASLTTGTPQEGDYVFGFFFDGLSCQAPCIMGVFPGIPQQVLNPSQGFCDSREDSALSSSPKKPILNTNSISEGTAKRNPINIGEPTTSRIYRNESIENTTIGFRKNNVEKNIETSIGTTWNEPVSQYNSKAPYNRLMETESGHTMEFDDTPGYERVSISHRKGTFEEIYPDSSKVTKIYGKNYEIYLDNDNVYIKGSLNVTVNGNINLYSKGVVNAKSTEFNLIGDVNVEGDMTVSGNITSGENILAAGDVVASDISLQTHIHGGVNNGGSFTNTPT